MCAALGKLPSQGSNTIIFATAPNSLDAAHGRTFDTCGGFAPNGCGTFGYANDDIFFLEICMFSMICANRESLFRVGRDQAWHCDVGDGSGFRELQRLLATNPNY